MNRRVTMGIRGWVRTGAIVFLFAGGSGWAQEKGVEEVLFQPGVFTSSAVCGKCHQDIYAAWSQRSVHAKTMSNPNFLGTISEDIREDLPECLMCHAPTQVVKEGKASPDLVAEGITCDFCHSVKAVHVDREMPFELEVGATKRGPLRNPGTPSHKAVYSELHTKSEFCAGCHEYTNKHGVTVLSSYSEWQAGPYPARQVECQGCHMEIYQARLVAGQSSDEVSRNFINLHEVPGGRSAAQLQRALGLKVGDVRAAGGETAVEVTVTNQAAGHKIPGGFPNRLLRLEVTLNSDGRETRQERVYQRVVANASGIVVKEVPRLFTQATTVRSDNRIAPQEARRERFVFPGVKKGAVVEVRLSYETAPPWPGAEGWKVEIFREQRTLER